MTERKARIRRQGRLHFRDRAKARSQKQFDPGIIVIPGRA